MAHDARSGRGLKIDERNLSEGKTVNSTPVSTSGTGTTDIRGLKRSTPETFMKPFQESLSSPQKSNKLENRTPLTSPDKYTTGKIQRKMMSSSSKNSDCAGKVHYSSSSSGSRNSEKMCSLLDMNRRNEKKNSLEEMAGESRVNCNQVSSKRRAMDARIYKAFFKMQRKRCPASERNHIGLKRLDKLSQKNCDVVMRGSKLVDIENNNCNGNVGEELKKGCVEKASEGAELVLHSISGNSLLKALDEHAKQKLPSSERIEETVICTIGDIVKTTKSRDESSIRGSDNALKSKRRKFASNTDSDTSATIVCKVASTSLADHVAPSIGFGEEALAGICIKCSKRRRIGIDEPKQGLCSCTLINELSNRSKDNKELEVDVAFQHEKISRYADLVESSLDIQINGQENLCFTCKSGGNLLCCVGKCCNKRCHLTCLDPPLDDAPIGVWLCHWCTKRKIKFGVHSVLGQIESIWDSREVEVSEAEGPRRQKQYLVKYKGLAHAHNHWMSESHLLSETPLLISKFNQNQQMTKWNSEWAVPHRLLKKRTAFSQKLDKYQCGHDGNFSDCSYEWLVKWCGLDYEHVTWELESSSILCSSQGHYLIQKYENRQEKAKEASLLANKGKKRSLIKLSEISVQPLEETKEVQNNINKLLEYWHKCQHVIVFDEQERVIKVVLFILSLSNACCCWPFIIITTSTALSCWEAEFERLAPSVDVVVYSGSRDTRKAVRTMEFKEEGCLLLQVLLSSPEAIVEDFQVLQNLKWEAVIIDECQLLNISSHFERIKMLTSEIRMLLFNGRVKDTVADYLNVLSLLDSDGDCISSDNLKSDKKSTDLGSLKEKLSKFIAYDWKFYYSRFVEYWVPVQLSNVQLEQYCATLLSNSIPLFSPGKNDPVGAHRDILISARKCCDHPYIMDMSLQGLITKGLPPAEYLDVGIKASGKLQLLDRILVEIKNQQLRVVILFQSIHGSNKVSIGDILDDFLRQRFGLDSYERIDGGGVVPSKKQAALNRFNKKEGGQFVFLLENRACLPSIKLVSVDVVIIFSSDWNLANDIRLLKRISIESQSKQIKLFRLYSLFTLEEKLFILAKNNTSLDSNLQNASRSSSNTLLMWGASNLFDRLDDFHRNNKQGMCANVVREESFFNEVFEAFLAILSECGDGVDINYSIISKVRQDRGTYILNLPLYGERTIQFPEELPHVFWRKLLKGKYPRWRYSSGSTQRNRKRVHYSELSPKKQVVESYCVGKKHKKMGNSSSIDPISLQPGLDKGEATCVKEGDSGTSTYFLSPSLPREKALRDKLFDVLKLEIPALCDILGLPVEVKNMAGRFLEYVVMNHHVNDEPASILQAFKISVCWVGASLLKHKICKKTSLERAKKFLEFFCKEEEASSVYLRLRPMKKNFMQENEDLKELNLSADSILAPIDDIEVQLDSRMDQSKVSCLQNKMEIVERSFDKCTISEKEHMLNNASHENGKVKVQKRGKKRWKKLLARQDMEIQEFNKIWDEKMVQLEKEYNLEAAVIRAIHGHSSKIGIEKLKILDEGFGNKKVGHQCQKDICFNDMKATQIAARNKESQKVANWLAESDDHMVDLHIAHGRINESSVADIPGKYLNRAEDPGTNVEDFSEPVRGFETDEVVKILEDSSVAVALQNQVARTIDSTNPPKSGKEIDDGVLSCNQGKKVEIRKSELAPDEMNGCIDSVEFKMSNIDSVGLNVRVEDMETSVLPDATGSQNAGTTVFFDDDFPPFKDLSARLAQPVVSTACSIPLPQNQVLYERFLSHSTAEMLNVDAPIGGNGLRGEQAEVPSALINPPNIEVHAIVPDRESQISTLIESPLHHDHFPSSGVMDHSRGEGNFSSPTPVPIQSVEEVHQDTPQTEMDLDLHPPVDAIGVPLLHNQSYLRSSCEEHNQSIDLQTNLPKAGTSAPMVGDGTEIPNPVIFQPPDIDQPCPANNIPESNLSTHFTDQLCPVNNISENDLSTQLTDEAVLHSLESFSDFAAVTNINTSTDCPDLTHQNNQPGLGSASEDNHLSGEVNTSPNNLALPQVIENTADILSPPILQPSEILSVGLGPRYIPIHSTPQETVRIPPITSVGDPLQNELKRICYEIDQATKAHEDVKLQLKSECDKEIDEVVTQIRSKYEAKLRDAEAAFLLKKKDLDENQNKVLMNKLLAETFSIKCKNILPSWTMGMQKVAAPNQNLSRHLHQLSFAHSRRPPPLPDVFSTGRPTATQQVTASSVPVHQSLAAYVSTQSRPPIISTFTPSSSNFWASGDIRAPAPHLQQFRSSSSVSRVPPASFPRGIPSEQAVSDLPRTCMPHLPLQHLSMPTPYPTSNPSGSISQIPSPQNLPVCVAKFPGNVQVGPNTSQHSIPHYLQNLFSPIDSMLLATESGRGRHAQYSLTQPSSSAGDVVCLSDDD